MKEMNMATHYADANILIRVYFTDNGEDDLEDQAHDAVMARNFISYKDGEIEDFGVDIFEVHENKPRPTFEIA